MDYSPETVAARIPKIANLLIYLEKSSILQVGEIRIFPSEMHLMQLIAKAPNINATEMARRMGVTKGAISQTLTRLEKKGILTKAKEPAAKNELTARFTDFGDSVLAEFASRQAANRAHFSRYLAARSPSDLEIIDGFLAEMEHFLRELS